MEKSKPLSKYTQSHSKEWIINKNSDKAWSCYQQWQEFCWLLWGQGLPLMTPDNVERKGSWELFLHFTVLGMLSIPFFTPSCLKGDHVQCQELPPCLPGNNSWSLNKWLLANSALISVVFITPCFHHVRDFLVSFLQRRS